MPQDRSSWKLPTLMAATIEGLRGGIRRYVCLEGLASLVVFAGVVFWLGLALDWLFEPSRDVRIFGWWVVAGTATYLAYRRVVSRLLRRPTDAELALVLERRYPELKDSLLTTVEVRARGAHSDVERGLVEQASQLANEKMAHISLPRVLDRRPLVRISFFGVILALTVLVFAFSNGEAFGFWLRRLALSPEPWPRSVRLTVEGFTPNDDGERVALVARDGQFDLVVRADLTADFRMPNRVDIRYRLADGRRGRAAMARRGNALAGRDDSQEYRYQFSSVASDMTLDIVGGDARIRDLQLRVVERPRVVHMELECQFPEYLQRPPRTLAVSGDIDLPAATRVLLKAQANKPLQHVTVDETSPDGTARTLKPGSTDTTFELALRPLEADRQLFFTLHDTDNISSREPYRLLIAVVPDEPPQIAVRLFGVRTAITAEARIPFAGEIRDDHGIDRLWFEYQSHEQPSQQKFWREDVGGATSITQIPAFDLRAFDEDTNRRLVELEPGERFSLAIAASDAYDLSPTPRTGSSQVFAFEIVTAAHLRGLLERRELTMRQRFEAIYERMLDTRNLLGRLVAPVDSPVTPEQPTTAAEPVDEESTDMRTRRFRIVGAKQNVTQAASETIGVATGFDDILAELVNNRIATPELKKRLADYISQPLKELGNRRMPDLQNRLQWIEEHSTTAEPNSTTALQASIRLADEILVEMTRILKQMLELEDYNEVLELLRNIINEQDDLQQRTRLEQLDRLKGLLED